MRKKGRRERKGREGRWARVMACVVILGDTPALVVGLLIALSGEAINQLPIASVYDHKFFEYGSVRWISE